MRKGRGLAVTAWLSGPLGLVLLVVAAVFLVSTYSTASVASQSMEPTYSVGERIVFERIDGDEVRRGDVVLFTAPERYRSGASVIKRVIGVGGDRIVCCEGEGSQERITVNGRPLGESYVKDGIADGMHRPYDVQVPEGRLFLLGDYRVNSVDSRFFASDHGGTVPAAAVQGRVIDDYTGPALLGVTALLGIVLALAGLGFGIAAFVVRRAAARQPAWPLGA